MCIGFRDEKMYGRAAAFKRFVLTEYSNQKLLKDDVKEKE